jgi:hypothetical protein
MQNTMKTRIERLERAAAMKREYASMKIVVAFVTPKHYDENGDPLSYDAEAGVTICGPDGIGRTPSEDEAMYGAPVFLNT